ncbi:MAG: DUF2000 domain-containing protein [Candidatus Peregrinibacteria bacterium]
MDDKKCVLILDEELPLGLIANASAVLALTLGKIVDGILGHDIQDKSGENHLGITNTVLPILKSNKENLTLLCEKAKSMEGIVVVDFSDVAQRTKNYEDYAEQLAETNAEDLRYLGIALFGDKKAVNSLAGSLPLLR